MTTKIIQPPSARFTNCPSCKALFEYEHEDIRDKFVELYPTGTLPNYHEVVTCPGCKREVVVGSVDKPAEKPAT